MRAFPTVAALLLLAAAPDLSFAQGGAKRGGSTSTQAPVGHRQPQSKDVPPDQRATAENDPNKSTDMDRALDRALRGICRGC
jgi:hypothetical protein